MQLHRTDIIAPFYKSQNWDSELRGKLCGIRICLLHFAALNSQVLNPQEMWKDELRYIFFKKKGKRERKGKSRERQEERREGKMKGIEGKAEQIKARELENLEKW